MPGGQLQFRGRCLGDRALRQQTMAQQTQVGQPDQPEDHPRRGELEQTEGPVAQLDCQLTAQQVGRRADQGRHAAEDGEVGDRNQQLGQGRTALPTPGAHYGDEQRRQGGVAQAGAEGPEYQPQQQNLPPGAIATVGDQPVPQRRQRPAAHQPLTEQQHRQHRQRHRIGEPGKTLLRRHLPGKHQRQGDQQRRHLRWPAFRHKGDEPGQGDRQGDEARINRPEFWHRRPPERQKALPPPGRQCFAGWSGGG